MDKYHKLQEKIREEPLIERLKRSRAIIGELCRDIRLPKISIPAQHTGEDIFITTTIQDAIAELSSEAVQISIIKASLERAADECQGLQMFPTMPVSADYRQGYNDGVCEAGETCLKLDCSEILAEFIEDAMSDSKPIKQEAAGDNCKKND